jgi:hypothetical protein
MIANDSWNESREGSLVEEVLLADRRLCLALLDDHRIDIDIKSPYDGEDAVSRILLVFRTVKVSAIAWLSDSRPTAPPART